MILYFEYLWEVNVFLNFDRSVSVHKSLQLKYQDVRKLFYRLLVIGSHYLSIYFVVIQVSLIEEGTHTAFEILALRDFQVEDEERFKGDCSVFTSLYMELCSHHSSEDASYQTFLCETCFTVVKVLLQVSKADLVPFGWLLGQDFLLCFIFAICRLMHQRHLNMKLI